MTEYTAAAPSERPYPGDAVASVRPASLSIIIGRIEEAVEAETHGLKHDRDFDLQSSNARKSRHLYELTRAMKGIGDADMLGEHSDSLKRLRETLGRNEAAIRAHLNAVSEVATLMRNAIRHAEADGTYSAGEFGWGT